MKYRGTSDAEVKRLLVEQHPDELDSLLVGLVGHWSTLSDAPWAHHVASALALLSALAPPELTFYARGPHDRPGLWILLLGDTSVQSNACITLAEESLQRIAPAFHFGSPPASAEALEETLRKKAASTLILPDLTNLLQRIAKPMYVDIRGSLTSAYHGKARGLRRVSEGNRDVESEPPLPVATRLSLLAGLSVDSLATLYDTETRATFLARMAPFLAGGTGEVEVFHPPRPAESIVLEQRLAAYHRQPITSGGVCHGFAPDAEEVWRAFRVRVKHLRKAAERYPQGADPAFDRSLEFVVEFAWRTAVLLAFSLGLYAPDEPWALTLVPVQLAVGIAEWIVGAWTELTGQTPESRFGQSCARLIMYLQRAGTCTLAQVHDLLQLPAREIGSVTLALTVRGKLYAHTDSRGDQHYSLQSLEDQQAGLESEIQNPVWEQWQVLRAAQV